jgi:CO/xanthine dehydrogenase Mo-binding subunit
MTDTSVTDTRIVDDRVVSDRGVLGTSPTRPDGIPKVQGRFAFSSDLWAEGMVWGRTLRAPHPHARITRLDVSPAWRIPGVEVIVTAADVPGATYGLISADQPVFASDTILYAGQAVAAVAADHPETARRACEAIVVEYEALDPVTDPERAIEAAAAASPTATSSATNASSAGRRASSATSSSRAPTRSACRTRPFSASSLRSHCPTATEGRRALHLDAVAARGPPPDRRVPRVARGARAAAARRRRGSVRRAREDVSLQVHVCLLALRTGRPVKMMYGRDESFLGHVHRHPGRIWMRHHARADGTLVNLECRVILDGGAYASTSSAVLINAVTHVQGPYRVPNARIDGWAVRTNNPPCGAMRGFGVQQACFAHESQIDKLAAACGLDPVEIRIRNAIETGDPLVTGQVLESVAPTIRCLRETAALPLPPEADDHEWLGRPGGAGRTADASHVKRGVGYALRDQEPHVLRGLRRLRDGPVSVGRRRRLAQARNRRSRSGLRHDRSADRTRHPRRRRSRARTGRHLDRVSGVDVRVSTDLDVGWGDRHAAAGPCVSGCSSTSRRRSGSTLSAS